MLQEERRTEDFNHLWGTIAGQVTSSLTCNTKSLLQTCCCPPSCPISSATSSSPSLRLCPVHRAPTRLLCSILPARGRTGERRRQPPAKVKAAKEGSVSSIRSAQSADCCCNPSALGLLHCSASALEAATQAGPHSPCLHGAASPQPPGKRGEEEAADDRNLPELFRAQLFAMLVAINCFSVFWERGL